MADNSTSSSGSNSSSQNGVLLLVADYMGVACAGLSILLSLISIFFYCCLRFNRNLKHHVDRISIRLLIVGLSFTIFQCIGGILANVITWPGFWCSASIWMQVFFGNVGYFLVTCIAVNLHLVFLCEIRTASGSYEGWFMGGSVLASLAISLPPIFKHVYGFEPIEQSCWFVVLGDQSKAFYWELEALYIPQMICVVYCLGVISCLLFKLWRNTRRLRKMNLIESSGSKLPRASGTLFGDSSRLSKFNDISRTSSPAPLGFAFNKTRPMNLEAPSPSQRNYSTNAIASAASGVSTHSSSIDQRKLRNIAIRILAYPIALSLYELFNFGEDMGTYFTNTLNFPNLIVANFFGGSFGACMAILLLCVDPSFGTGVRALLASWGLTFLAPRPTSQEGTFSDTRSNEPKSPGPLSSMQQRFRSRVPDGDLHLHSHTSTVDFYTKGVSPNWYVSSVENPTSSPSYAQSPDVVMELQNMDLGLPESRHSGDQARPDSAVARPDSYYFAGHPSTRSGAHSPIEVQVDVSIHQSVSSHSSLSAEDVGPDSTLEQVNTRRSNESTKALAHPYVMPVASAHVHGPTTRDLESGVQFAGGLSAPPMMRSRSKPKQKIAEVVQTL